MSNNLEKKDIPWVVYGNLIVKPGEFVFCQLSEPEPIYVEHHKLDTGSPALEVALERADRFVDIINNHAKQVEAAYREGWNNGRWRIQGKPENDCEEIFVEDWEASDAKAALEGAE